jgi:hypothetical protein
MLAAGHSQRQPLCMALCMHSTPAAYCSVGDASMSRAVMLCKHCPDDVTSMPMLLGGMMHAGRHNRNMTPQDSSNLRLQNPNAQPLLCCHHIQHVACHHSITVTTTRTVNPLQPQCRTANAVTVCLHTPPPLTCAVFTANACTAAGSPGTYLVQATDTGRNQHMNVEHRQEYQDTAAMHSPGFVFHPTCC